MFIIVSASVYAQETPPPAQGQPGIPQQPQVKDDYPDERLQKFVDVNKKLAPHQQEGEAKMVKAIEDEGMKPERFNEILTARQQNDTTNAGADAKEMGSFNAAAQKIMGLQQEFQQKMQQLIVEEGMEPQEFQEIYLAYQQSPKVQQKIDKMIEEDQAAEQGNAEKPQEQPEEQ